MPKKRWAAKARFDTSFNFGANVKPKKKGAGLRAKYKAGGS
jgi:hypothetical protein